MGAGCSVASGLPTWQKLIKEISDKFVLKTNESDLLRIASRLDREVGIKFREEVCDRLRTSPTIKNELQKQIASLDVNLFITTNHDTILEDSFRQIGYSPKIISHGNDIPTIDESAKTIIKLHGDINSPTSIVISSADYTSYESKNKSFVDFLNALFVRKTILFIGTSFDDLRLRQADDYIINLYRTNRKKPYIILKAPQKSDYDDISKYDIDANDFNARIQDFEDRGFYVIPIDDYEDVKQLLHDVKNKLINSNSQRHPKNELKSFAQQDYEDFLANNLRDLIEEKTKELCERVRGNGVLPPPSIMVERVRELIKHLDSPSLSLSAESSFEGYLTVADTFLMTSEKGAIQEARTFYEKANIALKKVAEREKWEERLLRVRAKLLFFEGKGKDAIESIEHSNDHKTISIKLALLIDTQQYDEAYNYITNNAPHPAWVHDALLVLIHKGETQCAKELLQKTINEFEDSQDKGKSDTSPAPKGISYEKLYTIMAEALYNRAIRISGKSDASRIYPKDITEEGKDLLRNALEYLDFLYKKTPNLSINESFFMQRAKLIDCLAAALLNDTARADTAARVLVNMRPLRRELVEYVVHRGKKFNDVLDIIIRQTEKDFPNEAWAYLCVAYLESLIRGNDDNVWNALQKAATLSVEDDEKEELSSLAFEIGQVTKHLENAIAIVQTLLPGENNTRRFLEAYYSYIMGNEETALVQLKKIESQKPNQTILAHSLFLRGNHEAKSKKWHRARKLLERSLKMLWHPATAERLLSVLTHIPDQDASGILKLAEEIEEYGESNENLLHLKAQAARAIDNYKKAAQYWYELLEIAPNNEEYANGLAEALIWMAQYDEALNVLKNFIKGDEKTDLRSLALACQIYEIKNDYSKAFNLLNTAFKNIENAPPLLLRHVDLGYRTGNEAASNLSLQRLIELKQKGKVPDDLFSAVPSDQLIDIFRRQRLFRENLNELYKKGQIPRSLLCKNNNIPVYLDWRVRTQNITLSRRPDEWTDFTIYATNGMRVVFLQKRRQLVPITAPEKAKEIVIDQHALITLHRLGLLERIQKRFVTIYYPEILNFLWAAEQKHFAHHQLSRKKTYESLKDKLDIGRIKEMVAPDPDDENKNNYDTLIERIVRLAALEKLILIDAYGKEEEYKDRNIKVIRLSQICEWLYAKGKISVTRYNELLSIIHGELPIIEKINLNELDKETLILIADVTLDVMEGQGLIDILNDSGLQVVIERWSANEIRNAVHSMQFREEVGKWQQDLANIVKESATFKPVKSLLKRQQKTAIRTPGEEVDLIAWQYAEEKQLPLLTDDRCLQMLRSEKYADKQFGTDALLKHMYAKKFIGLEEYASCFFDLCKWRYRFLVPDEEVLLYFAKEYINAPPGAALIAIAEYGRKCMEDRGLFMGLEPTDPPMPLGVKLYTLWSSCWVKLLIQIWQDETFSNDVRTTITKVVYEQFLPDVPPTDRQDIRMNLIRAQEKLIFGDLFVHATGIREPEKLHALLKSTFKQYGYDEEKQIQVLKNHLELIAQNQSKREKQIIKFMVVQALKIFYGKGWQKAPFVDVQVIKILEQLGLISNATIENIERPNNAENGDIDLQRDESSQRVPAYIPDGPMIVQPSSKITEQKYFMPHVAICSVSKKERQNTVNDILRNNYSTSRTKQIIQSLVTAIANGDRLTLYNSRQSLLKDFRYTRSLFSQMSFAIPMINISEEDINEIWENLIKPDLKTVLEDLPSILKTPSETNTFTLNIEKIIAGDAVLAIGEADDLLPHLFDWYLENLFFIPLASPFNPWQVISKIIAGDKVHSRPNSSSVSYHATKKWLAKNNSDPLAYLMALDIILNARASATNEENDIFTNTTFYSLLDECLEVLISNDIMTPQKQNPKIIKTLWSMHQFLARYFIRYLDLYDIENMDEERKILTAWWMARKFVIAINSFSERQTLRPRHLWLADIERRIEREERKISLRHLFTDKRKYFSMNRYKTLMANHLLSTCCLSLLKPDNSNEASPFLGIKKPTTALDANLRDRIIDALLLSIIYGEGQIYNDNSKAGQLSLLWHTSIIISAPAFLRRYYEDALELLGKNKIGVIAKAEEVVRTDYLNNELSKLPIRIKDNDIDNIIIPLVSLYTYLLTSGTMPDGAEVFRENEYLLREISNLNEDVQFAALAHSAIMLDRLYAADIREWTDVIERQFSHVNYEKCSKNVLDKIVPSLTAVFLRSSNFAILEPIIRMKASNKDVRQSLSRIKSILEDIFPDVPEINRENIRKVLSVLHDIPTEASKTTEIKYDDRQ